MTWQEEFKRNITSAEALREVLPMTDEEYRLIHEEAERFPMAISRYYCSLIDPADPDDPIRRMAVPSSTGSSLEGLLDTSGEHSNTILPGIQHKYRQTTLVLVATQCAMYCRYCFRRRFVGMDEDPTAKVQDLIGYLHEHPEITNCLLSGGDAFLQDTKKLESWLEPLSREPQLDFIRLGTRTPVTFPIRITSDPSLPELLGRIGEKKQLYVVTHFNHPKEFTDEAYKALRMLQEKRVVIKNQTVLLKGVNADPDTLAELLRKVTAAGIVQHYIFQCRPVVGATNYFQVPIIEGSRIVNAANAMQNGLGKCADYTMSHVTGKIRILGQTDNGEMLFQYKQAKDPSRIGQFFTKRLSPDEKWLN